MDHADDEVAEDAAPSTTASLAPDASPRDSGWSSAHRVAFRFWFCFLVIVLFPFPLGTFPGTGWASDLVSKGWDAVVLAVSAGVLHLGHPIDPTANGSGDRTYDWILLAVEIGLALVASTVWTALDRRCAYPRLREVLRIAVRYELGAAMINYGMAKLFFGQFSAISVGRLLESYGDSSPMALLWTFMGYSRAYCAFTGVAEITGGVLLFWRRTTTLGALVSCAVLANVVALNFCYDVPVKIYSTTLLLQALWLLARNARPLFASLVGGVAARVTELGLDLRSRARRRGRLLAKAAFLLGLVYVTVKESFVDLPKNMHGPFEGFYEVSDFTLGGAPVPEDKRWRRVYVGIYRQFYFQTADGHIERLSMKAESVSQPEIELRRRADGSKTKLRSSQPGPGRWTLAGDFFGEPVEATLVEATPPHFFLMDRGFHWVNEFPLNR